MCLLYWSLQVRPLRSKLANVVGNNQYMEQALHRAREQVYNRYIII
jgi:hypothetical protein